jgi:beta-1,4-mannosyl-glycoprotein beta-1,4-N-acetylglucosaminyltransferase
VTRPKVIDAFPFNNELDILECRLVELFDAVDAFVLVEADVDHQDHAKPFHYAENAERFAPWADKIVAVQAKGLPTATDNPDPWAREHAQREFIGEGLARLGVTGDDIILQSDVDEIPTALTARNVRPSGMQAFEQRLHCFAVDWLHPDPWRGTVAGRASHIWGLGSQRFGRMRDARNMVPCPPHLRDAGWHLSWLGGKDAALAKIGSFCHPEILERTMPGLLEDFYLREGWHVDGKRMRPVDVDESWPRWIVEGKAPSVWFRPR